LQLNFTVLKDKDFFPDAKRLLLTKNSVQLPDLLSWKLNYTILRVILCLRFR